MIQLQRETVIVPKITSMVITPIMFREEGELENPGNTSIGEYNEQQSSERTPTGEP